MNRAGVTLLEVSLSGTSMEQGFEQRCSVCGEHQYAQRNVLWPDLIDAWQLSPYEVEYINRQQGFHCVRCGNNLRSLALAGAICASLGFQGYLSELGNAELSRELRVLEINQAGGLTRYLSHIPGHRLVCYPEYDMSDLKLESEYYDVVIHSDTLEHVQNPERALSECRRVLKASGVCIFTVPLIYGRLTRSRSGLRPSFHGREDIAPDDQLVHTEFGADVWAHALRAGFRQCSIRCLEFPAALALVCEK